MVSVLVSSLVDRGFIGGVMVSVLASSVVDRGFIGGVMGKRAPLECCRSLVGGNVRSNQRLFNWLFVASPLSMQY